MKNFQIHLILFLLLTSMTSFGQGTITSQDLKNIIGDWEGSLSYLDYQTNKPYAMPAHLNVTQGRDKNRLILNNIYPNEPKANGSYKIKIAKNGHVINRHVVTSRKILDNGLLEIQAEFKGRDNRKKAIIRQTYLIGKDQFIIRKEVQNEKIGIWVKRSEFSYKKKA